MVKFLILDFPSKGMGEEKKAYAENVKICFHPQHIEIAFEMHNMWPICFLCVWWLVNPHFHRSDTLAHCVINSQKCEACYTSGQVGNTPQNTYT